MRVLPLLLCLAMPAAAVATANPKPPAAGTAPLPATAPATWPALAATRPVPAGPMGAISIQAVQGTQGGPAVSGAPVTVEMVFGGRERPHVVKTKLDEHGVALIENIPVSRPFRPRVTVQYDEAAYMSVGQQMDVALPTQRVKVTVYETTDDEPAWDISMRHILIRPTPHGPYVNEMIAVQNPDDRAWLGKVADGGRVTVPLSLPQGAEGVESSGAFAGGATATRDGIAATAALLPGQSQYRVGYLLRTEEGQIMLPLRAPAAVRNTLILVPAGGMQVEGAGLQDAGQVGMGPNTMRAYRLRPMARGESVTLTVTGLQAATGDHAKGDKPSSLPKTIALVGGGALLVVAALVLMFRPRRPEQAEQDDGP